MKEKFVGIYCVCTGYQFVQQTDCVVPCIRLQDLLKVKLKMVETLESQVYAMSQQMQQEQNYM